MPPKRQRGQAAVGVKDVQDIVDEVRAELDKHHRQYIDRCDAILAIETALEFVQDGSEDKTSLSDSGDDLKDLLDRIWKSIDSESTARVRLKSPAEVRRSLQQFFRGATLEQCDGLKEALDEWSSSQANDAGVNEAHLDIIPNSSKPSVRTPSELNRRTHISRINNCANGVFRNLFACCDEHRHTGHEANLLLGTYSNQSASSDSGTAFEILFAPDTESPYYELQILSLHSADSSHRPRKRLKEQEAEKLLGTLCEFLREKTEFWKKQWRFEFRQENTSLWFKQSCPPSLLSGEIRQPLPLCSLLGAEWTSMSKLILAVTLAYSLYHLYDGPWVGESWSRDNILFFQVGNSVSLQPFMRSTAGGETILCEEPSGRSHMHKSPSVLLFGVTLIEIHLGQSLTSENGQPLESLDALLCAAQEIFHSRQQNMNMRFRKAVQQCLNAHFGSECQTSDEFRRLILDSIVVPLEEELEICFGDIIDLASLDHEAAKLKISDGNKPVRLDMESFGSSSQPARLRQPPLEQRYPSDDEDEFPHKEGWQTRQQAPVHLSRTEIQRPAPSRRTRIPKTLATTHRTPIPNPARLNIRPTTKSQLPKTQHQPAKPKTSRRVRFSDISQEETSSSSDLHDVDLPNHIHQPPFVARSIDHHDDDYDANFHISAPRALPQLKAVTLPSGDIVYADKSNLGTGVHSRRRLRSISPSDDGRQE